MTHRAVPRSRVTKRAKQKETLRSLDTPPRAQPLRPRPGFLGTAILALPSLTSSSSSFSPCRPPQLLRERVQQCYLKEGVNHYQNCKEEVKAYLESIKNVGVHRANIGAHDRAGGI